jgi:hypothetical protein
LGTAFFGTADERRCTPIKANPFIDAHFQVFMPQSALVYSLFVFIGVYRRPSAVPKKGGSKKSAQY